MSLHSRYLAEEELFFPLEARALWLVSGEDRMRYLNGQVTCDVPKIGEGCAQHGALCNAKGRMEGDLFIARAKGAYYIDGDGAWHDRLSARLQKYLIADDVEFHDLTADWQIIHSFGRSLPDSIGAELASLSGFAVENGRYLIPGWDLWLPKPSVPSFLQPRAKEIVPAVEIESMRIEFALPVWGSELTEQTLPPEMGHEERWISYQKGCYIGQEIIARLRSVGQVPRLLTQLQAPDSTVLPRGTPLFHQDKEVGAVTSGAFSPRLGKGLALALLPRALSVAGTFLRAGTLALEVREPLSI